MNEYACIMSVKQRKLKKEKNENSDGEKKDTGLEGDINGRAICRSAEEVRRGIPGDQTRRRVLRTCAGVREAAGRVEGRDEHAPG